MNARVLQRLLLAMVHAVLMFGLAGCGQPETDLLAAATKGRDDAQLAYEAKKPGEAERAAARAERAAQAATRRLEKDQSEEAKELAVKVNACARLARTFAALAREEGELRDRLDSLKLKAYRSARQGMQNLLFAGLSTAADRASTSGYSSLSEVEKTTAQAALHISGLLFNNSIADPPQADWKVIATQLKSNRTEQLERTAQVMALTLAAVQQNNLALGEISIVDPAKLNSQDARVQFHAARGLIYLLNGFDHLAEREFETALPANREETPASRLDLVALVCGFRVYLAFREKDFTKADTELMRAAKLWPNNPLFVFLTGERLLATGEYERAADSLEQELAGTKDEWLAQRLAARARYIRDKQGKAEPLFTDKKLLLEFVLRQISERAKESEGMKAIQVQAASLRTAGAQLLSHLPGGGKEDRTEE